jgi:predicted metal-dependent peptidase
MARKKAKAEDPAAHNFELACGLVGAHPLFGPLMDHAYVVRDARSQCPHDGWAVVVGDGAIHVHPTRRAAPEEWAYVLAHALLHLGFGHVQQRERPREWNAACDAFIGQFLATLKLGQLPADIGGAPDLPSPTEESLYTLFCEQGIPPRLASFGTGGRQRNDMILTAPSHPWGKPPDWQALFARGLVQAVASAVQVAAGVAPALGMPADLKTEAQRARAWFINSYPLLGALAASFTIIEDPLICFRLGISIAAVDAESREVFINPGARLNVEQVRFVMAHELLHVGLRHDTRRQERDPFLWNCAADYVINAWLVEMEIGEMPTLGVLYDPELKGESAESVYDRIVTDMRRYRRLATLRGVGASDILERGTPEWWRVGEGVTLDEFYRRALAQGLTYHQELGRGYLPADLVEEIQALSQPPIPWDVELAKWFDHHFPPVEKTRSYARPSRHQSATPAIPRPRWVPPPDWNVGRTFGVLLDTSGSMERGLLARALGAIASYSIARDVPGVRVVFCDAATYDQGYMAPEEIAGRVKVRGRGGTILQPGVDLLEHAENFPKDGPLLIITDGLCDRLTIHREHAFLLPKGHSLPFVPRGEVFRIE